jgi:hypothetical protein
MTSVTFHFSFHLLGLQVKSQPAKSDVYITVASQSNMRWS